MKYIFIALIAIAIGFGAAKLATKLSTPPLPVTENQNQTPATTPAAAELAPEMVNEEQQLSVVAPGGGQIDNAQVAVSFTGKKGTATYDGSFSNISSNLKLLGGVVAGTVTVDTLSLTTAAPAATTNWKSAANFNAATYPIASF
ncbi:MAG TPA: YceI family protein, partial [Candidatus Paceibacterota bacterium]|nr:YceI family protein [Candidatus Paceibacterota bacterium]